MHIAYSAIQQLENDDQQNSIGQPDHERLIRYQAYLETCAKFHKEIADIQRYTPGWVPVFR